MRRSFALLALACAPAALAAQPPARPVAPLLTPRAERIADSVLALLSLEERVGQMVMTPGASDQTGPTVPPGGEAQVRAGQVGSFLSFWGVERTRRMQRIAVEESPRRIPLLFAQDVIHGWRTIFPVPLGEAASWDTTAARQAARVAAVEASAQGIHWTFAPMVDVARDPRWGRIVEGAGEDPFLGGAFAAARVEGFQGADLSLNSTLAACVKHFAAYGAPEGGRDYDVVDVGERTLWEVFLPPYEAAVRAGAVTLMPSFNEIDGVPAHGSAWLLRDVLRDRWGFRGVVVSDWAGVGELMPHGVAADSGEAATLGARSGVDVEMSSRTYAERLVALVRAGRVPQAVVDSAAWRVLVLKAALGLFDDPYRYIDADRERTLLLRPEHRALAREVARKSIVLLRNEPAVAGGAPVLPLRKDLRTLAVIGPLADDALSVLGSWNGNGQARDAVSVLAGLRAVAPNVRLVHERAVSVDTASAPGTAAGIARAVAAARGADAVLLVLGERGDQTGEATSRASLELPGAQLQLAQAVARAARGKPVVAVLLNGRPLATPWLADGVPALVESWYLGVEHGHALADVLFGDANPSGKLPVTIPYATGQVPIHHDRKNTGRPPRATEHYTSKYQDVPWTPLYPFGHGLSYTTFRYANLRVARETVAAGEPVTVTVEVTNAGARAGDEVAQLYLRDDVASVTRPVRMLRGFQRLSLAPGETRAVTFTLAPEHLALNGRDMRRVVEPGTFTVWAGGSSAATLAARFRVTGDTLVVAPAPPRPR